MKRQRVILLGIAICIALSCIGGIQLSEGKKTEISIEQLAYDIKKIWENIVYVKDNYETGAKPKFSPSKNRIIRINCPVDVHIYEEDTLVGQIINDEPVEVDDYMFFHGFNSDGEKFAYISAEVDCTVKIIATGDGTVSYTVQ